MNKAPSKFILSHSSGGECQWRRCLAVPGFRGDWTAINESYRSLASWPSWSRLQCGCWTRTRFLWFQINQTIIANISRFFLFYKIHKTRSLKSANAVLLRESHKLMLDQNSSKTGHSHNACSIVSGATLHWSHRVSSVMVRQHKLSLVGKEFL